MNYIDKIIYYINNLIRINEDICCNEIVDIITNQFKFGIVFIIIDICLIILLSLIFKKKIKRIKIIIISTLILTIMYLSFLLFAPTNYNLYYKYYNQYKGSITISKEYDLISYKEKEKNISECKFKLCGLDNHSDNDEILYEIKYRNNNKTFQYIIREKDIIKYNDLEIMSSKLLSGEKTIIIKDGTNKLINKKVNIVNDEINKKFKEELYKRVHITEIHI